MQGFVSARFAWRTRSTRSGGSRIGFLFVILSAVLLRQWHRAESGPSRESRFDCQSVAGRNTRKIYGHVVIAVIRAESGGGAGLGAAILVTDSCDVESRVIGWNLEM